jgi:hypothetical protein
MFKEFKDEANIYRLVIVQGKSSYGPTPVDSCIWYLHPLGSEYNQVWMEKYGKEFTYTIDPETDIKETDRLEIDWSFYRVKWVAKHTGIIVKYKRVLLTKE